MNWSGRARAVGGIVLGLALSSTFVAAAQQILVRVPEAGAELPWWRPTIVIDLPRDLLERRDRLRLTVDADDVTDFVEWQGPSVRVTSPVPLPEGPHAAELRELVDGAHRVLARVEFTTRPPRRSMAVDMRVSDASGLEAGSAVADAVTLAPHADGSLQTTGTTTSFDITWEQAIPLEAERAFRPPLVFAEHTAGALRLSGGLTDADLQADTRFVGSRVFRQVAGASYDAGRAGTLSGYTNLADALPSADGTAARPFWIQNLSWRPRLPGSAGTVTLLAQHASSRNTADDEGAPLLSEQGSLFGAHARVSVGAGWMAAGEAVFSRLETDQVTGLHSDYAVRGELAGKLAGQRIQARVSRVGTGYRNLADPGLQSDRQDGDVAIGWQGRRLTYGARFAIARDSLDGSVSRSDQRHVALSFSATPRPNWTLSADIDRRVLNRPTDDKVETRAVVRMGAGWGSLRTDVHGATSRTDDSRLGSSSWTFLKAVARVGPWRTVTVSGGAGVDRRTGVFDLKTGTVHVEAAFALIPVASRIAVTLAGDTEERTGHDVDRQWVSASWSRQLWTSRWNVSLWFEGRWQQTRDRASGRVDSGGQWLTRLAWNPEWTWSR